MSKEKIKEIRQELLRLKRAIESQPRIWTFRGRSVVRADEWKFGDWTKLPDRDREPTINEKSVPPDYWKDYLALMEKLEDPDHAHSRCWHCAIPQAQDAKKKIDRLDRYWQENGGEAGKEEHYQWLGEPYASSNRRDDAIRQVEWRIYNELGGANGRTCDVANYFHCPYGNEWRRLQEDGRKVHALWRHVDWYDSHWTPSHTTTPTPDQMKWYHFNEPPIIDVTNYDDIIRALQDGRLDKIIDGHLRYMKENDRQIWAL